MAMAAWLARTWMSWPSSVVNAFGRREYTSMTPSRPASPAIGAAIIERNPVRPKNSSDCDDFGNSATRLSPATITRFSASARPVAPTPSSIHRSARSSAEKSSDRPESKAQRRMSLSVSRTSRIAPSAWISRLASSTVRWRTESRSEALLIRAAISRRLRSISARLESSRRDRSRSAMRRALAMAAAAWSASERTSAIWAGSNASVRIENVPSAPNTSSPLTIGATTIERIPTSSTTLSASGECGKAASFA